MADNVVPKRPGMNYQILKYSSIMAFNQAAGDMRNNNWFVHTIGMQDDEGLWVLWQQI